MRCLLDYLEAPPTADAFGGAVTVSTNGDQPGDEPDYQPGDDGEYVGGVFSEIYEASHEQPLVDFITTSSTNDCSDPNAAVCSTAAIVAAVEEFNSVTGSASDSIIEPSHVATDGKKGANTNATDMVGAQDAEAVSVIEKAKEILGCSTEHCVVTHPSFEEFAKDRGLNEELELNALERFKVDGPRDSMRLLSNFDIDKTLALWAGQSTDFFPYPFAMIDFETTHGSLARIDIIDVLRGNVMTPISPVRVVKRPNKCAACVINTDVSTGSGKHWISVFVDCRDLQNKNEWSVEFFNSSGNPPADTIVRWMGQTRIKLQGYAETHDKKKTVVVDPVTDKRHQESRTECGLYALFYVRARLDGTPRDIFRQKQIRDEDMVEFRKHIFRHGDSPP